MFDSDAWIKEMESIYGVEDTSINYDDIDLAQYEQITERELRGDM